jgi:tetratricopeptide (TPR) repeat protein
LDVTQECPFDGASIFSLAFFAESNDKYKQLMYRYWCALNVIAALAGLHAQTSSQQVSTRPDYSQEAAVIEEMSTRLAFENNGNFTHEQTSRVRVQSDAGVKHWGLLTFPFSSATEIVEIDYVRVRKSDGSTVITPPDNAQDLDAEITRSAPFYSDLRERHVAVKGLAAGDVLEYQAHWHTTKPLAPGQFWFQYRFRGEGIVLDERVEVKVPADRAVKVKGPAASQRVVVESGARIYSWTQSRLENKSDPQGDEKKAIDSALGHTAAPDVEISSFQSWEEVGRWYWDLQKERIDPSPAIRAKAAELTRGLTDDDLKLKAIYKFVGTQYRYIGIAFGIGRYQPHSADDVLGNSYGDCKDKHTLLAALLQASGVTLHPALISSSETIDDEIPSPAQFNHVIGYLPRGTTEKDAVWLDTTPEVAPFGYLMPQLRDKQALVMAGEKSSRLISTPADSPIPNTETFRIDGSLNDEGTFDAKVEDISNGDAEVVVRAAFRQVPQPQWKELVQQISYRLGFAGTVSEIDTGKVEDIAAPFHFSYSYDRKEYPTWKSDKQFTVPGLPLTLPPLKDDAKSPLWLGSPTEFVSESRVSTPSGFTPSAPPNIDLKYDFAEYHASYSVEKGALVAKRRLLTREREVSVAKFADYRTFVGKVRDDVDRYVQTTSADRTISSSGSPTPGSSASGPYAAFLNEIQELPDSDSSEAIRLEREGREQVAKHDVKGGVSLLQQAIAVDPKFSRAWVMLALSLLSDNQYEAGIEAFHKTVALEPRRATIPKALGFTLMSKAKFEEAIPVWQDFMKAYPDDVDGPTNLASCLSNLRREAQAAAVLEAAVKIKPDQAGLRFQLASVYLRADDRGKALESYRKLGEIDKEATFLNDAAYEMANADIDLPLALEYAKKAVRAANADSAKISLDELREEDLNKLFRLAANWDTLGWVHERMTNLEEAERFLQASWKLTQGGAVAGHLCHLYKRIHRNNAAIQMCRVTTYLIPPLRRPDGDSGMLAAEAQENLKQLTGAQIKPAISIDESNFLARERNFRLPRFLAGTESAEFFVLLATDAKSQTFKVEDVKFISGSDKMKLQGKQLKSIDFKVTSPGEGPARFVRRGILGCYQYSGCSFVLLDPASVHSLN